LRLKPLWKSLGLIVWRLARCQPFCKGGFDPVKEEDQDEWYRL
jgi:putative component of membrane protein insertase Oxa1/YidC/SpoIIIJ protein YidD